jgi:hypothetical protein
MAAKIAADARDSPVIDRVLWADFGQAPDAVDVLPKRTKVPRVSACSMTRTAAIDRDAAR